MSRTYRKKDEYSSLYDEQWKATRDKKRWYKPGSIYKKLAARSRKAKEKDSFRKGKEIPIFKKTDVFYYC